MSTTLSKNKEKRPRSSSESNKSFVKNVTSRVSGLLPSRITKWFSSPSSSNTNGSAQVTDATDSSTEDEAPESPVAIQPPAKRMRYTSPGNLNQFVQVETRCTSTNTETIDDTSNINTPPPMERINFRKEKNLSHIQSSNESVDASDQDRSIKHSLSSLGHSTATKRKSLFDNSYNESYRRPKPTHAGSIKDPYFKPSLLSSPFYVGRTMYGGAASSYMSQPNIKERSISLTNETVNNNSVNMSHSARRVMDLLEHYSSPLGDAKRIPQVESHTFKSTINNSPQQVSNQSGSRINSYKTQELYVPSVATILTIKRRSRLMDTTNAARQIIASHSSSSEFLPYPKTNTESDSQKEASGDKLTTKVKSRITRTNRERNVIADDSVDNVSLPNVVLQIDKDNLPKFTFGASQPAQTSTNSSIQTPVIITPDTFKPANESDQSAFSKENDASIINMPAQVDEKKGIKFSSPVTITTELTNAVSTPPKFNFGSPERNIEKIQEVEKENDHLATNVLSKTANENKLLLPPSQKSTWKCLDCWVLNKTDVDNCVCCGGKKPVELGNDTKKCSLCKVSDCQPLSEKCAECSTKANNVDNLFVAKVTNSSKWKCNDCWVDNDESADKCVCCGGKNPKKTVVTTMSSETKIEDEWKCNDCWIKNKNTLDKCAACSASKPGSKINSSTSLLPKFNDKATSQDKETSDNTFKSIANSQGENWKCSVCLIKNLSNRGTCFCCGVDKPGTVKESHKRIFNFHQPSEITFKFGSQLKAQEVPKKQDNFETEESNMGEDASNNETNNNVLPKTPTFNFGSMPLKKIDEQAGTQSLEAPKVNFTFGVPKKDSATPVLGTTNTLPELKNIEEKEKERVQEVPQVFTPPQSDGFQNVSTSLFKSPVPSQNAQELVAPIQIQPSSTSKEITFFNTSVTSSSNSEAKTQQNSFTFSSIRPATNLFATTTTAATSVTAPLTLSAPGASTMSIFQKADPTTTTVSFFQATASKTTTAVSLFPKAESTTTTASVSAGATPPVFSFGSLGQAPQADKPKFQFSFGTNKTETPPLFKPTFGAINDNNVSSNKFNIPSNSITSGNGLTGSPLNNATPLNTGNALTTDNSLASAPAPALFGTPMQKDWKIWPANNNILFPSNTTANTVQKPTFTFGTSTSFNSNNTTFGTATQPAQNVFGIPSTVSQPMFGNQLNTQTTPNIFGSPQPQSNSIPMGMFGTMPNTGGTQAFGTSNPSMPTFETPSLTPAPAPTFNFGGQQQPGIFGFGQTQPNPVPQEGQPSQPGMYNFVPPGGTPQQLQFNMGSAPNTGNTGRRVIRKAMRRTQR